MEPKQPRQGRWHRDPARARPLPLEAIRLGAEILILLDQTQFLTGRQVANRFFTVPTVGEAARQREQARALRAANRSLFRLKDRGWVRLQPVFSLRGKGKRLSAVELNVLTEAGIEALRRLYADDPATWHLQPTARVNPEFVPELINHEVATRDAVIALERLCETHGLPVQWWSFDSRAWMAQGQTSLIQAPDVIFVAGEHSVPLLVEVDLGTESIDSDAANSWRTKIARYENYIRDLAGNDPLFDGCSKPQMVIVAPPGERARNLHAAVTSWGSPGQWWITSPGAIEPLAYTRPGVVFNRSGSSHQQALAHWLGNQ